MSWVISCGWETRSAGSGRRGSDVGAHRRTAMGCSPGRRFLLADLLLAGDRLARALAGARVGVRALAADREPTAVADAFVAPDLDLATYVGLHLAAQVTLDPVV